MASDLEILLSMGFEPPRAEAAIKRSGGLQDALAWLEDNQDKAWEEVEENLKATETTATTDKSHGEEASTLEPDALTEGEQAKSMLCNDCGKKFRSMTQAEAHAERTEHVNFSESVEEIAPLTEKEKKAKLDELRAALAEKRSKQAVLDKEEAKKNEKIRMKSTQEVANLKEELQLKEAQKAAAAKKKEKLDDLAAKKRIQNKIAADKEERRLKAEQAKALREGGADDPPPPYTAPSTSVPISQTSKPSKQHTEARLRLQTAGGTVTRTFSADTTLFEVGQSVAAEHGGEVQSLTMTFPKKVFTGELDFGKTVKEAGLMPSAVLIVK